MAAEYSTEVSAFSGMWVARGPATWHSPMSRMIASASAGGHAAPPEDAFARLGAEASYRKGS